MIGEEDADWQADPRACMEFIGGEEAGLKRVWEYMWQYDNDNLEEYFLVRNGLLGKDFSSKWSPWLAAGCLSPRWLYWEIVRWERGDDFMASHAAGRYVWWRTDEIKGYDHGFSEEEEQDEHWSKNEGRGEGKGSYWMVFELESRDYMHMMGIKHGSSLFGGLPEDPALDDVQRERFAAWREGRTGVPIVDAVMREMSMTGYASNRARLIVASFFVRDLGMVHTCIHINVHTHMCIHT
jgi:deoxyribodipyrimidine photo-lyase